MFSNRPWMIVAPSYAWRVPQTLNEWLETIERSGSKNIYFILTCGSNIDNSENYLEKLCKSKNMNNQGCFSIVMPENYIALFSTPTKEELFTIIQLAEAKIDNIIHLIEQKNNISQQNITMKDKQKSGIANALCYAVFVKLKKFYVTEDCISCGKCVNKRPLSNIHIENDKPVWGNDCTHGMACICHCPVEAIAYGTHGISLPWYTCPKKP